MRIGYTQPNILDELSPVNRSCMSVCPAAGVDVSHRSWFPWPPLCLFALAVVIAITAPSSWGQTPPGASAASPEVPSQMEGGTVHGVVLDVDKAAVPGAHLTAENTVTKQTQTTSSDSSGGFTFALAPGDYTLIIKAPGFAPWKVENVQVSPGQILTLPEVSLGVEALTASVDAITREDLAEQQITEEEHQRILGILPNFYVSYLPSAAPLTRKQKFKLAIRVSTDPVTLFTTSVTAAIEQAQGDFADYGPGFPGYAQRYAATYGDRLSSTFFGAALLPSLFHQDPRYFYRGHGSVAGRALYAISTVVICKGDNGRWQPNYSNILGNLAAGGLAGAYYPRSERHSVQVTISDTLLNTATGAFGTLFQEFALRHFTRGGFSHKGP